MNELHRTSLLADQQALKQFVGYSCRRAHVAILEHASKCLAKYDLRPGWFTALMLLSRNPGLSSLQLSQALGIRPPNVVALVATFAERSLIEKRPHSNDTRSLGLYLTAAGRRLVTRVERAVLKSDIEATSMLNEQERSTLLSLLTRIYEEPRSAVRNRSKAGDQ